LRGAKDTEKKGENGTEIGRKSGFEGHEFAAIFPKKEK
jgi:hypothetical protein